MEVTFSNKQRQMTTAVTIIIHGKPIEIVEEYKYLGTIFDNLLKFTSNTEEKLRKFQQHQYLLTKLSSFEDNKNIFTMFYYSYIGSVITFSIVCCFNSITLQNRSYWTSY